MRPSVIPIIQREGAPDDVSYVFHSWLKGCRGSFPDMGTADYYELQHARIERLLSTSPLVVLHPQGAPAVICAWAVLDTAPEVAHYVHVRGERRRAGLATRLLAGRSVITHLTEQGRALKRKLGLRYMPHLLDVS